MLPIVEILAGAADHAERVDWLLRCPIGILHREHMTIRRLLQRAGLQAGVTYLDTIRAYADATRTPDGTSYPMRLDAVSRATKILKDAV